MIEIGYAIAVICCCVLGVNGLDSDLQTPCPGVFVYRFQDHPRRTWYGTMLITTQKDSFVIDSIRVLLDREAEALQLYDHRAPGVLVDTLDNTEYLVEGLNEKVKKDVTLSVTFLLRYKSAGSVPKVTAIRVNENTICSQTFSLGPNGNQVSNAPTTVKPSGPQWSVSSGNAFTSGPGYSPRPTQKPNVHQEVCGTRVPDAVPLIINGKPSRRGEWPWHGALYSSDAHGLTYLCGVTLISPRFVVTAAHCVTVSQRTEDPVDASKLLLAFGRTMLSVWNDVGTQDVNAEKVIVHPEYNSTNLHNDLAVIRLVRRVDITVWVRPACLWPKTENPSIERLTNRTGTIIGWGFRSDGVISETLQHAKIPVVDPITCFYIDEPFYAQYRSPKSYCAGILGSTSACNGDSGGGMVFKRSDGADVWQLRGVVSLAALDHETYICDITHYVVFTDIAFYLHWIYQNTHE